MDHLTRFDLNQLSQAIERERRDRDVTWAELSRQVGVATSTVRRFSHATDAEADGVLALIGWLGVAPETFVTESVVAGRPLPPARHGMIRIDVAQLTELPTWPSGSRAVARTTIQRLAHAAQESQRSIASLTRWSPV